jgi:protein TonB
MRAVRFVVAVVVVSAGWAGPAFAQASGAPQPTLLQLIEMARAAVEQGRASEAEGLLMQAVTRMREERLAARASQGIEPGQAVRIGGDIREPLKIRDVKPVYPEIARAAAVSGIVILEIRIDTEGSVTDARVLRSIALLDQAALDAVYQWRFTPTVLNGQAVPVIMTVTVNFRGDS